MSRSTAPSLNNKNHKKTLTKTLQRIFGENEESVFPQGTVGHTFTFGIESPLVGVGFLETNVRVIVFVTALWFVVEVSVGCVEFQIREHFRTHTHTTCSEATIKSNQSTY